MNMYIYRDGSTEPFIVLKCRTYDEYISTCELFNRDPTRTEDEMNERFPYYVGRSHGENTFHTADSKFETQEAHRDHVFMEASEYFSETSSDELYSLLGMESQPKKKEL